MKNSILTIALLLASMVSIVASNDAYVQAMQKALTNMRSAASVEDLKKSANAFARIAEMNTSEWLPDYYAALTYANMGFRSQGSLAEKDEFYAQAKKHIQKADAISPNNSEIVAVQGFITMGELAADPQSRGQHLSGEAMQLFGKAISLNRQNPRAIVMMAQMEYGMAQFFGQGPEKACGLLNSSLELFAKEEASKVEGSIEPRWGKSMAEEMKQMCK
ncbi:hypothetical protein [Mariniradius sediminis]|jgi:tetratricopeptide (TPR) repeat protein|uniref:Tetratricopeptide repeat-containing protein n=1 Tax=Mariniradius sediminis TaxID=2909237 RepID=A0ABS9BVF0_9BACT|nr:hypothetical protein [Mariniradius sediminis]MCF1751998.1 hypothetical protein [Mariniradius sediminis]